MKNKKIIFLVAIVCCLAVSWLCFGAWSIEDTNLVVGDFTISNSYIYLYIIPSSSIPIDTYSNIAVDYVFSASSSTTVIAQQRTLDGLTVADNGIYHVGLSAYTSGRAVRFNVSVSSVDLSSAQYFISACYRIDDSTNEFVSLEPTSSNFVYYLAGTSSNRTLIVFIDKLSSGSGGVSQEQYDDLLADYEQAVQEKLEYQQGYVELRSDFDDLQSDYNVLQQTYDQVNQQLAQLQHDFDQLQIAYDVKNSALEEARTEIATLEREVEYLIGVVDSLNSGNTALNFIGTAFEKVGDILQIEILPNITIGTIVAVPLILGVVFLVLRLVRGE